MKEVIKTILKELKSIHKKRKKTQEQIIAAEAAVTVALDRVHSVENKMLEYLSNAQGAMQNLYQIKRAGELVTTEIPKNCSLLTKSVGGNLKGNAVLPGNFFGENRECRCHRKSHLGANLFHAAFQVWVHPEVHIDCICHSNTPLS